MKYLNVKKVLRLTILYFQTNILTAVRERTTYIQGRNWLSVKGGGQISSGAEAGEKGPQVRFVLGG